MCNILHIPEEPGYHEVDDEGIKLSRGDPESDDESIEYMDGIAISSPYDFSIFLSKLLKANNFGVDKEQFVPSE